MTVRKRTERPPSAHRGESISAEEPLPGLYRMRMRRGAVYSAIRIWNGPPRDPDTGEEMDRSWRWQATVNGKPVELDRIWPKCAHEPIDLTEYRHLMKTLEWGRSNAPDSPQANPHKPVDPLTAPLPF